MLDDEHLAEVAREYERVVAEKLPIRVTLGEHFGVSPNTIRRWVYEARNRGLLPRERSGKGGG